MSTDVNVVSVVDEVCAQVRLTPELILKLRNVARNNLHERSALRSRLEQLDTEELLPEEKAVRKTFFAWVLHDEVLIEEGMRTLTGPMRTLADGEIALESGQHAKAVEILQKATTELPDSLKLKVELALALGGSGKGEEGLQLLNVVEEQGLSDADLHFARGRCQEYLGYFEDACNSYVKSLERNPNQADAAFRLAYYLDLRGEDERAIELYRKVTGQGPAFISAMVNLALLLEDKEDLDSAITCLKAALKVDPGNKRAELYLRDCVESLDMYYDEAEKKENERLEAILRIPISDFELSVRSRNCLAKMNIKTLGDMVRKTEAELLAYKNFGETSLTEIKALLEQKNLRLGMFKEEDAKRARAQRMRTSGAENPMMLRPIADLGLSVRSRKCMQRLNIESIGELLDKTEAELLSTKNFGQTSLNEIKAKLVEKGLSLRIVE